MSLVRNFSEEAVSIKRYPNTRSKIRVFGEAIGYCYGIIRLATEIEAEWNVCSALHHELNQHEGEMNLDSEDLEDSSKYWESQYETQGGYGHA